MERSLKAFLAVARCGNLTSAAEIVGLTQPALTKTIQRLEEDFGAGLFQRTARGMRLTRVGRTLFTHAEAIELQYRQAHEEVKAANSGVVKELKISAGPAYHTTIVPDLIRLLSSEFPETDFILSVDVGQTSITRLLTGELDFTLGAIATSPPEGLETLEVLRAEMVPYCRPGNPLALHGTLPSTALSHCQWIVYKRDALLADKLGMYYSAHQLAAPRIIMRVDPLGSAFRIVATSDFLMLAPAQIEHLASSAGLRRLKTDTPIWKYPSGAWFRQSSRQYPIMRRALELLPGLVEQVAPAIFLPVIAHRT
ncbi:LysR family transcriptional regulator [Phyllobacterium sp. 628]|uniref:LysR family transcriptional regulator n=1 Tax=Phyllobacterium sp. 628 TaxID=2718938 RepID=UPI0016624FCF|nr:LysR family transcriptional regulator [Phyllobacterium sp. 628]QND53426.1 LysR family transcriptional regulator [Phyllobacterium sp. 628]